MNELNMNETNHTLCEECRLRHLRDTNRRSRQLIDKKNYSLIAKQHLVDGRSYRDLAKEWGVSHSRIQQIVTTL